MCLPRRTGHEAGYTPGQDVRFGGSVKGNILTRTIYGEEADNAFPIYWQPEDQVIVTTPTEGMQVKQGIYQVPEDILDHKEYADEFVKVSDAGVQWGEAAQADFYSVYPVKGVTANAGNTSFTMNMPSEQAVIITETDKDGEKVLSMKPNMDACFMYAKQTGVANGSNVNLGYHPLSTAIRFILTGPSLQNNPNAAPAIINKIVLHAPQGVHLVGDFTVELKGETPVVTPGNQTSNELRIMATHETETGGFLTLEPNEKIELNAFIIPQDDVKITNDWYIEFTLDNGTIYKKNLGATDATADKATLVAGMIHRLPPLPAFELSEEWSPENWMENIPRNVYLSEVSLPGSWNTVNNNFQGDLNIANQYAVGVRAFHLDVCWRAETNWVGNATNIIDLGIADGTNRPNKYSGFTSQGKCMTSSAKQFTVALNEISNQVKPSEYMVLLCSFAQDSYDWSDKSWMQAISEACAMNDNVIDGSTITQNTVVSDVQGKVIVIVGCEAAINNLTLPANSKCIFSHLPMTLAETQFTVDEYNTDNMYSSAKETLGIQFYNTHAQITWKTDGETGRMTNNRGYAPTLTQREKIVDNIFDWSRQNYNKQEFKHNAWIYAGLGGYYTSSTLLGNADGGHKEVAQRLNKHVNDKINNMSSRPTGDQTGYYPVGIVLMNFVNSTTEFGPETVRNIYQLNTKYRKAYDADRSPVDGSFMGSSDINSSAPGYSAGVKDENIDAFGWTRSN